MSSSAAAIDRFVTHAQAVLSYPDGFTPVAIDIAEQLVDAADRDDTFTCRVLVLEVDRLVRAKSWSV